MMPGEHDWMKRIGLGLPDFGAQVPMPQMDLSKHENLLQSTRRGLGSRLFAMPEAQSMGLNPKQVQDAQRQAMRMMGLGLIGNVGKGPGSLGAGLTQGMDLAQNNVMGAMQRSYENAMRNRVEQRQTQREDRADSREERMMERDQFMREHALQREQVADQRYESEREFQSGQAERSQKRWETEFTADQEWRRAQLAAKDDGTKPPTGYRWNSSGGLEFIPGGPADPSVAANQRTLRPIPSAAAKGIIENRSSIKQIDRALAALEKNPEAFGLQNYLPDAVTQRLPGEGFAGGTDARAQTADIGSLKIHDRSGAAVTAAEFPRLRPFIPSATDDPSVAKTKLENLKANLELMADEIESFYTPDSGYRPLPPPTGGGLGNPGARKAPPQAIEYLKAHPEAAEQFRAKYGYLP
jgi:hypothetical protein